MELKSNVMKTISKEKPIFICGVFSLFLPILSLLFVFFLEEATALPLYGIFLSGAAALSFFVFLVRRETEAFSALLVSVAYALSSFTLLSAVYAWEYSVLIALFPLVILGVEEIAVGHNVFPYAVLLSASLLMADNLSVVTFITSVLWFVYRIIEISPKKDAVYRRSLRFLLATVCAVFISAVRLFPRLYALDTSLLFAPDTTAPLWLIPAKLFPAVYDSILYAASPFLYVGILPLLLIPVFFAARSVSLREKILSASFLAVLVFTTTMPYVSDIYTLLGDTLSFRFGGTLPLVFLILTLSARGLQCLLAEKSSVYTASAGVLLTLLAIYHHFNLNLTTETDESYLDLPLFHTLWLTVAAIFVYVLLLPLISRTSYTRVKALILSALTLLLLTEMTLSASSLLTTAKPEADNLHRITSETYTVRYEEDAPLEDGSDLLYYRRYDVASGRLTSSGVFDNIENDGAEELEALLSSFGVIAKGDTYEGMHPLLLLLSGVNYTDKYIPYYTKLADTDEKLYKTDVFLSLGTSVKEGALTYVPQNSGDPFLEFIAYVNALTGRELSLFEPVTAQNGVYYTAAPCLFIAEGGRVSIRYGSFVKGTTLDASSLSDDSKVVEMNEKDCKTALQAFYGHRFEVTSSALGEITGNLYTPSGSPIFLTNLPYNEDYRITVDEEATDAINANGLLAIRVSENDYHFISIRYTPTFKANDGALVFGITMTAIFSALTLMWLGATLFYCKKGVSKKDGVLVNVLFTEDAA